MGSEGLVQQYGWQFAAKCDRAPDHMSAVNTSVMPT